MHREPWQVRTALETGIYSHVLILPIPLDFDFGLPQLQKLMHLTNFPWLLSNVLHQDTNAPPEGVQKYLVIEGKTTGLRIGLIGLVERYSLIICRTSFICAKACSHLESHIVNHHLHFIIQGMDCNYPIVRIQHLLSV